MEGFLVFPGAGGDSSHPTFAALVDALAPMPVRRADFPYRKEGRKAPDRAPKLITCVRDEAQAFADELGCGTDALVLGGRSMGGRMCSLAVTGAKAAPLQVTGKAAADVAEPLPAAGLILLSYPLHPPGKPEKLRTEHFTAIDVPCLFISGSNDPFGKPDELEQHTGLIPAPVTHIWIEGAGHDPKGADEQITQAVRDWCKALPGA